MDSNHDKVIQSHLVHDGCAIVATFSGFRAASLPVCPSGPSSSQLIEEKQRNFVLGTWGSREKCGKSASFINSISISY